MSEEAPRRIRFVSVLTAFAAGIAFLWIGKRAATLSEIYAGVRVPMPGMTVLLLGVPLVLWAAVGVAVAAVLVLKDLWFDERRAGWINQAALPLVFLFYLAADFALRTPMESIFRGIRGP